MKKVISVMLCLSLMICLFVGCSSSKSNGSNTANTSSGESVSSGSQSVTDAEKAISDRKASGKYPKIIYSFFDWLGAPKGTDRISSLVSNYCKDKIGVDVSVMVMDATSYRQNVPLMIASGEQIDIISANALGLTSCINNGYITNLSDNKLFDTYGSGIKDVFPDWFLDGCRVGNSLYAIPTNKDWAIQAGFLCIKADYLDGIGYDYESKWATDAKEYINTSWDELRPIFAQLAAKYPDKTVFSSTATWLGQGTVIDPIGGDWYGVLIDPTKPKVSDVWSSQEFMDMCKMFYGFNQLGYYPADALTSTVNTGAQVAAGTAMSVLSQGKPGYRTQNSKECSSNMICFQLGKNVIKSNAASGVCLGINSNCKDPIAAMQFLNLAYTDKTLSNLLLWGEEGVDYVVKDDGRIGYPQGVDVKTSEWAHTVNWEMPNQQIGYVWETDSIDLWDRMKEFNNSAARSVGLGFTWDNSAYQNQYVALQNIYNEYFSTLILGFSNPETTIPEMLEKMRSVGLDDYIAAKTKAFDAWAKTKGLS